MRISVIVVTLVLLSLTGCNRQSPEDKAYIASVEKQRAEKDLEMKSSPASPFNQEPRVAFSPLHYYPVDPAFRFSSRLTLLENKDTVTIYGTKGETRAVIRYGFITFKKDGRDFKMYVYKGMSRSGEEYYSLWFTDRTTGKETYGVGRYLDFELNPAGDFLYTVDFNLAYNPYCAYSSKYSCAVPSREDFLDLPVEAGEKKFHD